MKNKERKPFLWLVILLCSAALLGVCFTPAFAEVVELNTESLDELGFDEPGEDDIFDDSFGGGYQYTQVPIYACLPAASDTGYEYANNYGYAYLTSTGGGDPWLICQVRLPSGAFLNVVRFYYIDTGAGGVNFIMTRDNRGTTSGTTLISFTSSGTPGRTSTPFTVNETIRNGDRVYNIAMGATAAGSAYQFAGVRLFWRRQIRTGLSHPFTDIGGLPAVFQHSIAALYQSGITTGTTATTYSPSQAVNRGQMAVFLARALGLHWAGAGF